MKKSQPSVHHLQGSWETAHLTGSKEWGITRHGTSLKASPSTTQLNTREAKGSFVERAFIFLVEVNTHGTDGQAVRQSLPIVVQPAGGTSPTKRCGISSSLSDLDRTQNLAP